MNKSIEWGNWRSENENEAVWSRDAVLCWDPRGQSPLVTSSLLLLGAWPVLFSRSRCPCLRACRAMKMPVRTEEARPVASTRLCYIWTQLGITVPSVSGRYWKLRLVSDKIDGVSSGDKPSFLSVSYRPCSVTAPWERVGSTQERKSISDVAVL